MKQTMIPQFLIASPTAGAGKTTVTRALMEILTRKGLRVQPFKCGHDYIDPLFHEQICGCPSINLDQFMASGKHLQETYARHAAGAEVCIVEGEMGLFDGYDHNIGSAAELAVLLELPVILVVDAKLTSYSTGAMLSGYLRFDKRVQIVGVIFNNVQSEEQEVLLREACADLAVECFGCIAYEDLQSRKLKNKPTIRQRDIESKRLLQATRRKMPKETMKEPKEYVAPNPPHIVVARNSTSFSCLYGEHLEMLGRMGRITFINPEVTPKLPPKVDLLYLSGGAVELNVSKLSKNSSLLLSIYNYIERGGRTLAEGGGLVYLSKGIYHGKRTETPYEMADIFPFCIEAREECLKPSVGYRRFELAGQTLSGYESHSTQLRPEDTGVKNFAQVYDDKGRPTNTLVYRYKKVLATYTHLYWGEANIMKLFDSPLYGL